MSYATSRASFSSDLPDDAFWLYTRDSGAVNACSTSALSLVLDARAALGLAPLPAWDSSLIAALLARVAQLAASVSAWEDIRARLAAEGGRVTRLAVLLAVYFAYYQPHGLRLDAIALPDTSDLPTLNLTIGGTQQGVACWDPTFDADPSRADIDRDAVVAQSTYGVRVHQGEMAPASPNGPSTEPGPGDAVALLGILAAVALAVYLFSTAPERRV